MGSVRCFFGRHGHFGGRGTGYDALTWCLRCGRTWEPRYDFLSPWWERRRDLSFGRPASPNPGQEQGNGR